jgi:hypothetical protein
MRLRAFDPRRIGVLAGSGPDGLEPIRSTTMQIRRSLWTSALLSLVSLVAFTGSDRAEASSTSRPIHGTMQGVVTGAVSLDPLELLVDYDGIVSHLGKCTRHEDVTFGEGGALSGTITFVAANGDELWVSFVGHFTGANDAVATYTFTGGKGRFVDATGTAEAQVYTPDFVHVTVTFGGTIDY